MREVPYYKIYHTASMDATQTDFGQALEIACRGVDHEAIS